MRKANLIKTLMLTLSVILVSSFVVAQPSGADITFGDTDSPDLANLANRSDDGGTITTLSVDALQQNPRWKAYIGNITGTLTLDDSTGSTIFNWVLDREEMTGAIYSSRSDAITWGGIACASQTTIDNEDSALSFTGTSIDSVNRTFNTTTHPPLDIGGIAATTCPATSTFVNNVSQTQGDADFPIILLHDETNLVYTTPINPETTGYDGSSFDFQMIMANEEGSATTYYFYAEIRG